MKCVSFYRIALYVIYFMFFVGLLGHVNIGTMNLILDITPAFLLSMGLFTLIPTALEKNYKVFIWAMAIYAITFSIAVLGVATGSILGDYPYGPMQGISALVVPSVIGFNWTLVIL